VGNEPASAFVEPDIQNHYRFQTDSQVFIADLSAVIIPRMVSGFTTIVWHHAGRDDHRCFWRPGSSVILLDGMFNLISGIMSFFSLEITRLIYGKETREYPLGYSAFESLMVLVKGASILVLLLMALYSNIGVLFSGGREPVLGLLTIYVALAVLGCLALFLTCRKGFKQAGSEFLQAETQAPGWSMRLSVVPSGSPLGSRCCSRALRWDGSIAISIRFWSLSSAFSLLKIPLC
jgi:divalent metal cation (Fe/Co/Zn/Cd) transporter